MPLWLRRTTFNLLKEHYDKEKEEYDKQQNIINNSGKNEVVRPNLPLPDYITKKAPKK